MHDFEYAEGRTEAEVLQLLSEKPKDTELLAGGTDLVGLMKKMIVTPERVVNILEVESMQQIERLPNGEVAIGAVVRLDQLLDHPYLDDYPAVKQAIQGINSIQLQAQGTLGGEICQRPACWYFRSGDGLLAGDGNRPIEGDNRYHAILGNSGPAKFVSSSRIAPALICLDAHLRVIGPSPDDIRLMPLANFYRTPIHEADREHALLPGQLVTHVLLAPAHGRRSATYEVRHGEGPDRPLAAAAASLQLAGGSVRDATIVLGHVAPTPWISPAAAKQIVGQPANPETAHAAGEAAVASATPLSHNAFKVKLAAVAVKRAILRAADLETGGF